MKKYSAVDRALSSGPEGLVSRVTSGLRALEACGYLNKTQLAGGLKLWRTTDKWHKHHGVSAAVEEWPIPSELAISEMRSNPARLIRWIESGKLETGYLSFAAEALGEVESPHTKAMLLQLLAHHAPVVREGAIYGMANIITPDLKEILRAVADNDQSPGVRAAARELLDAQYLHGIV